MAETRLPFTVNRMVSFRYRRGQYDNFSEVPHLTDAGLAGIEAFHPKHTAHDTARCLELAGIYGLAVTGGSDFHGKYGEGEQLGECGADRLPF